MNGIAVFRLTSLTDEELIDEIDKQTDNMFDTNKVPMRHVPAKPDKDYDILIGELLQRFMELKSRSSSPKE